MHLNVRLIFLLSDGSRCTTLVLSDDGDTSKVVKHGCDPMRKNYRA